MLLQWTAAESLGVVSFGKVWLGELTSGSARGAFTARLELYFCHFLDGKFRGRRRRRLASEQAPGYGMDALRLLSRSTKKSKNNSHAGSQLLPSTGRDAAWHFSTTTADSEEATRNPSKKRKIHHPSRREDSYDFFGNPVTTDVIGKTEALQSPLDIDDAGRMLVSSTSKRRNELTLEERKSILKQHKVKVAWINPPLPPTKNRRKSGNTAKPPKGKPALYPTPLLSFEELSHSYAAPRDLVDNVTRQGFKIPSEVQLGSLPLLLDKTASFLTEADDPSAVGKTTAKGIDLLTVAPTGSGKTLAFLIPLIRDIMQRRRKSVDTKQHTSAIILAPTRELVAQIVNEGRKLTVNTGIKVTQMRKGMLFSASGHDEQLDDATEDRQRTVVKADIVVSTPGTLSSTLENTECSQNLAQITYLVLDEADILLDPLFRDQTLGIWNKLPSPNLRVNMWSATIGSNIEELAEATRSRRRLRLEAESGSTIEEIPLVRLVVGLKDSAVPNIQHKVIYAATEQGKLMALRQLLHPRTSSAEAGPPLRPPFLVFTQTIERAVALHAELLYDIPAEAGGIDRIAVLHSDLSDTARDNVMTRFRKGEVWVLITTDLLSRGVDFLGINGVVNYDIPTSSAAYVHRIGRTGRAGRSGGVAVTLYSKEDVPYLKNVANVVAISQKQGGSADIDQWLLESLPSLSKNEKKKLKQHGVEARTARGRQKDPKAGKKAQISTKSGYDRRMENRRKGAIAGSRRYVEQATMDDGEETDFGGFD